jgi:hypothetical protein
MLEHVFKMKTARIFLLGSVILSGCATYHMSTESLVNQLANSQPETKVKIIVAPPLFFFPGIVSGNSLKKVTVLDKNEKPQTLTVTNRTSIRITKKDGKRKAFYFDTLLIKDSTITGKNDHFVGVPIKPINLNTIQKIELQN